MKMDRRNLLALTPALASSLALSRWAIGAAPVNSNDSDEVASFTKESEQAANRGIKWLMKALNKDGGTGVDIGMGSDIGCTCMTGLAFMARGNTPVAGPRAGDLRRIRRYILRKVDAMGGNDITSANNTQLQRKIGRHAHSFFATLFLSQILGEGTEPHAVNEALKKIVDVVVKAQTKDGDWGSGSWAPTLGTVMGWVSLRAADFVGVSVGAAPEKTADHLTKKMKTSLNQNRGWMHELYKNASGIRVLYSMQREEEEIAKRAFSKVLSLVKKDNTPFTQAGGEEFLAFHLITETMLKKGGKDWNTWYPVVRDKLIKVQNRDGSWTGHHCITSRTFCTAAAVLVLTAPYRYLPISQA